MKVYKPSGWIHNGSGGHWYRNERSKYGVRYMCAYCGDTFLGWGDRAISHGETCEQRIAHHTENV